MPVSFDRRTVLMAAAAAGTVAVAPRAFAQATHDVQMLNVHPENPSKLNVFYPHLLRIQPGDTVNFLSVDPAHNSQTTDGMIPDGAEPWVGGISQDVSVTLETPGFYGYHCLPHLALGMVGLIIVEGEGMFDNLEAARSVQPFGMAVQVWNEIWTEAEANGWLSG